MSRVLEVARVFLGLGLRSFGGPIAHLGYFRAELVEKRRWLDDAHYGDLVALCQFLPGPASSQVVFALGLHRAGLAGALVASLCFTLPSALLMIAFAVGLAQVPSLQQAGWLHGLKLAAVAVVAQAVWGMGTKLCVGRARMTICLATAAALLLLPGALVQLGAIAAGGLVGWRLFRAEAPAPSAPPRGRHLVAAATLTVFALLLVVLPLGASTGVRALEELDAFYRSGSLVFGGGHVVLPLLRTEVVPRGWLTDDQFLAGYAAAQAVPGPLFTLAAYLGAAMHPGPRAWLHGLWCLLALFLPAWLLVGGALPFWERLRSKTSARGALAGANAAVVGVLLAALYEPVITSSVRGVKDAALALIAFALLELWKLPAWAVVGGLAALGAVGVS
ncbi:MAG: chromate efflux transporter [Myxococcota bacterium]